MAQQKKAAPDWERIEADYRAGILSVREIAGTHGLTEGAIRKRAKRDDWQRDLSKRIQDKAEALVRTSEVRTEVRTENAPSDAVIVEANAKVIADIRLAHRKDISRARKVAMSLLGELEIATDNIELFEELGNFLRSDDDKGQDKRNDVYQRVISSVGRIDSMKKLSDTLKTLVGLEREAYGVGNEPTGGNSDPKQFTAVDPIEAAKQYALLMNS
jgi:uncharacterized membrane protein